MGNWLGEVGYTGRSYGGFEGLCGLSKKGDEVVDLEKSFFLDSHNKVV